MCSLSASAHKSFAEPGIEAIFRQHLQQCMLPSAAVAAARVTKETEGGAGSAARAAVVAGGGAKATMQAAVRQDL